MPGVIEEAEGDTEGGPEGNSGADEPVGIVVAAGLVGAFEKRADHGGVVEEGQGKGPAGAFGIPSRRDFLAAEQVIDDHAAALAHVVHPGVGVIVIDGAIPALEEQGVAGVDQAGEERGLVERDIAWDEVEEAAVEDKAVGAGGVTAVGGEAVDFGAVGGRGDGDQWACHGVGDGVADLEEAGEVAVEEGTAGTLDVIGFETKGVGVGGEGLDDTLEPEGGGDFVVGIYHGDVVTAGLAEGEALRCFGQQAACVEDGGLEFIGDPDGGIAGTAIGDEDFVAGGVIMLHADGAQAGGDIAL